MIMESEAELRRQRFLAAKEEAGGYGKRSLNRSRKNHYP